FAHSPPRPSMKVVQISKHDRFRGAGLRARRGHVILQTVITERAFPRESVIFPAVNDAEWARGDAIPAAIADVRLHKHRIELGPHDCACRARFEAPRAFAVLQTSDIISHEKSAAASWPGSATGRSMNATCRHVDAPSAPVLS